MKGTDCFKKLFISRRIYLYLSIMLMAGIALMVISSIQKKTQSDVLMTVSNSNVSVSYDNRDYDKYESKLISILNRVEGVGDIDVILNYISADEKPSVFNETKKNTEEYTSLQVSGVIIVARGGDNIYISKILKETVSNYLGIPIHKVTVLKMK